MFSEKGMRMANEGTPGSLPPSDPKRSVARGYDMQFHGTAEYRGGNCPSSVHYKRGRFGRLFPGLPAFRHEPEALMKLGAVGGPMDGATENPDHPNGLAAGLTFLGQFIDHDITFDPTSSLERQADPEAVENFRTPTLELDNVYGAGPGASPHLYLRSDRSRLLVRSLADHPLGGDVPRNEEGIALLGDPRNDENLIVSQLHVAFLRFHNAVADHIEPTKSPRETLFEATQRLVRWHYQWVVLNEYLPGIVGAPMARAVLENRRFYKWENEPFIPVEFAVAAFRFGHSQIRPGYVISSSFQRPLFAPPRQTGPDELPDDLSGGRRLQAQQVVDWPRFFKFEAEPQHGMSFDARLSPPLMALPFASGRAEDPKSLAQRNLLRGLTFGLPTGQSVARAMKAEHEKDVDKFGVTPIDVLSEGELEELAPMGLATDTPLWYYILRESALRANGATLGPVGGRIVAEVLTGLLQGDRLSYLRSNPDWLPLFGGKSFNVRKLLLTAGVATDAPPAGPSPDTVWSAS